MDDGLASAKTTKSSRSSPLIRFKGLFCLHSPPPHQCKIMSPQAGWILEAEVVPRIAAVVPRSIQTVEHMGIDVFRN